MKDDGTADLLPPIRARVGAVAPLKDIAIAPPLPKTRSGKIIFRSVRGIANGADEPAPSTVDDPSVRDALRPILRRAEGAPPVPCPLGG